MNNVEAKEQVKKETIRAQRHRFFAAFFLLVGFGLRELIILLSSVLPRRPQERPRARSEK